MPDSRDTLVVGALVLALATSLTVRLLQRQDERILDALTEMRQLLEKTAAATDHVTLTNVDGDSLGKADAPLTMVEFTDLQCPYCRQFHVTTFEQIKKEYIDTGKVRYIGRDFPLASLHPFAIAAARATRCAGDERKAWEMRHTILVNNAKLRRDTFVGFARDLHLDVGAFTSCVADTRADAAWQKARTDALSIGISGTPSFVIGRTSANTLDGVRLVGARPYGVFDAKFKELLAAAPSTP